MASATAADIQCTWEGTVCLDDCHLLTVIECRGLYILKMQIPANCWKHSFLCPSITECRRGHPTALNRGMRERKFFES